MFCDIDRMLGANKDKKFNFIHILANKAADWIGTCSSGKGCALYGWLRKPVFSCVCAYQGWSYCSTSSCARVFLLDCVPVIGLGYLA